MMTLLETMLKSAKGMLKQGFQSELSDGECAYNGPNGAHCGIGFLIDPDQYQPRFESNAVDCGMIHKALINSGVDVHGDDTLDVLKCIQTIHDSFLADEWKIELTNLAKKYLIEEDFQKFCEGIAEFPSIMDEV